jgi:hypothetical protein
VISAEVPDSVNEPFSTLASATPSMASVDVVGLVLHHQENVVGIVCFRRTQPALMQVIQPGP